MIKKILRWIVRWFWQVPTAKPEKEKPARLKATEVMNEYVVIDYHGQKINLHYNEIGLWNKMSRKDKRAMAAKFKRLVAEGMIVFATINGKQICLKNKKYESK